MKTLRLLLLIGFLSACSTLPKQTQTIIYPNSIPNAWLIQGRASITHNGKTETANFKLSRKDNHSQLTLTGPFGFGQITVQQTPLGLLVNEKPSHLSLQAWMQLKLGWVVPINELERVIFKSSFTQQQDWHIEVSKYQLINAIHYPKIIRLKHTNRSVKVKLLLKEVHRLE